MYALRLRPALSATLMSLSLTASPGLAQEDREGIAPADWLSLRNASETAIGAKYQEGFRLVTLSYCSYTSSVGAARFDACLVRNEGYYRREGASWLYGTPSYVASQLSGRRITELEPVWDGSTLRFAAAVVANTGSQAKAWTFYYGTRSLISSKTGNQRIVDLDHFSQNGTDRYTAVMIANTGSDYRKWWWYTGLSDAQIQVQQTSLQANIFDVEGEGDLARNRHCVVFVQRQAARPAVQDWRRTMTWSAVQTALSSARCRPVKIRYQGSTTGRNRLFEVLMMDNRFYARGIGSSCSGSRRVPQHLVQGRVSPGRSIQIQLRGALPSSPVMLLIGPRIANNGVSLHTLGAHGCRLYAHPVISFPVVANSSGNLDLNATLPAASILGRSAATQFLCLDRAANTAGFVATNGYRLLVGQ